MTVDRGAPTGQRELATVLRDLAWTIQRLVPEVAGLDPLTNTEIAVIKRIQASPGITLTDLARHLEMQQSNASAAVRDLVERGLVARERSAADLRVTKLVPTEKSLAARGNVRAAHLLVSWPTSSRATRSARRITSPPSAVNFTAFESRFSRTC